MCGPLFKSTLTRTKLPSSASRIVLSARRFDVCLFLPAHLSFCDVAAESLLLLLALIYAVNYQWPELPPIFHSRQQKFWTTCMAQFTGYCKTDHQLWTV